MPRQTQSKHWLEDSKQERLIRIISRFIAKTDDAMFASDEDCEEFKNRIWGLSDDVKNQVLRMEEYNTRYLRNLHRNK